MVERNLAKVEVAGPSPVFRSTKKSDPFRNLTFFVARLVYLMGVIVVWAFGDQAFRLDFQRLTLR